MATTYDYFLRAFKTLVNAGGYGTQARLAKELGQTKEHINDVLHRRKRASQEAQERIATCFQMTLVDMLSLGQTLVEGKNESLEPFTQEYASLCHEVKTILESQDETIINGLKNIIDTFSSLAQRAPMNQKKNE